MIVDPDFLDHWKTRMLADLLDDDCAPIYVIRLWGHCQTRRSWEFSIPAQGLKAMCRFAGDADQLDDALQSVGFITRQQDQVTVVGWDEHNASLIANWNNGKLGGRPKKNNPSKTHGIPMDNPSKTHGEPIREDKIREDNTKGKNMRFTPPSVDQVSDYCRERLNNIDPSQFVDYYTSKGWMIGKNKMRDWKASVRTWEKRDNEKRQQPDKPRSPADRFRAKRQAEQGHHGSALDSDAGDLRPQVGEQLWDGANRGVGEVLDGDYTRHDSDGS